ncbi:MAG: ABC transporter ATP-binding protein [Ardenticatenaceae bacterium]
MTTPHLTLHQVSKTYEEKDQVVPAIASVSFSVAAGEFVALVGPSGCGKSTLFKMIVGLLEPDEGEIRLMGQAREPRTGLFGYMPQRDLLLPWRTILENVILGPELAGHDLKAAREEAMSLLPLFGLEGFHNAYPATLSGGMRQRAALLRTFLCHHDVMLFDEPFGALDALTRRDLQTWLLDIWRQFNKTILFITHDIEEALYLSDRVITLTPRPGRLQLDLTVELPRPRTLDILVRPRFVELKAHLMSTLRGEKLLPHLLAPGKKYSQQGELGGTGGN